MLSPAEVDWDVLATLAMAAGEPQLIPHEDAVYTRENTASPIAGWLSFQPLWQEICRTDPDLFD